MGGTVHDGFIDASDQRFRAAFIGKKKVSLMRSIIKWRSTIIIQGSAFTTLPISFMLYYMACIHNQLVSSAVASRSDQTRRDQHLNLYYQKYYTPATQAQHNMADMTDNMEMESQDIEQETPPKNVFIAPSIYKTDILNGKSYSHFSPIPQHIANDMSTECVLGVDEAGRGPVLGMQSHHAHLYTKAH